MYYPKIHFYSTFRSRNAAKIALRQRNYKHKVCHIKEGQRTNIKTGIETKMETNLT